MPEIRPSDPSSIGPIGQPTDITRPSVSDTCVKNARKDEIATTPTLVNKENDKRQTEITNPEIIFYGLETPPEAQKAAWPSTVHNLSVALSKFNPPKQ
jgi:hypothetical protein